MRKVKVLDFPNHGDDWEGYFHGWLVKEVSAHAMVEDEDGKMWHPEFSSIRFVSGPFDLDKKSKFYKNCLRNREKKAKICESCPFKSFIKAKE